MSLLGDDHDFSADDPAELAEFIADMEGIVGEGKEEKAVEKAKDVSDQREESGGSSSVGRGPAQT